MIALISRRQNIMADANIKVTGMSCMHCVGRVKGAVDALSEIASLEVTVGNVAVSFDDAKISQAAIEAAIEKAGYKIAR
jgi:Cu+-exporting ATPase